MTISRQHKESSRREFIGKTVTAIAAATFCGGASAASNDKKLPAIVLFTKVCQTLKLNFEEVAAVVAEAGLNGIDCPVRPGGEILPENVSQQLPLYANTLRTRHLAIPLLTTAITSVGSANTEEILHAAKKVGVQFYRLGFIDRGDDPSAQIKEVRAQLRPLATLNKKVGLGALVQNHSPAAGGKANLGGDLFELYEIVRDFDPDQIGVAFDIGHALVVHGEKWREGFEKLKPYLRVAYVKDVRTTGGWVSFGQGDIGNVGYFKILKEMNYLAPISLHIEFDWTEQGKSRNRAALVKAIRESGEALRKWLMEG